MFYGHAVCWVLGETLEAARQGAASDRGRLRAAARRWSACTTRSRPRATRATSGRSAAATRPPALEQAAYRFSGELEFGGQEHFYLETNAALALVDENGQIFVQSSTQHPSETQDIVAHVLGLAAHEVTVQCLRMGGGFGGKEFQPHGLAAIAALGATLTGRPVSLRLNRTQDITMTGKRHPFLATWEVGLRRGQAAVRAARHADQQRRLEPGPVRAGAGPGAVPHRQRLLDPEHRGARPDRQDQPAVEHRVPRLRRPAGHDRHRGHPRPLRAAARARRRTSCGTGTSTRPARPRRTGSRCGTPSGSRRSGRMLMRAQRLRPPPGRGGRVQRRPPGHQARAGASPRSSSASRST